MKFLPISALYPSAAYRWEQWVAQDTSVNSIGGRPINQSYRNVNQPIHVEPAAKLYLSPEALALVTNPVQ